jgi:hypothetical protein
VKVPNRSNVVLSDDSFPFTIEVFDADTGAVLWRRVVEGPGVIDSPTVGGPGTRVGVRIIYPDGRVEEGRDIR